jgi:prepilin-type N-terminal cleavage/methylation domain-containing protein
MRRALRAGFTLLEMLAVIFLMSVVLFVAIDFYLDLSRASQAATDDTRNVRRAVVLLDRVAHDLEGATLLVRPPDVDPLAHPWLFVADARDPDAGADRVKFVRRGHEPRTSDGAESDLEMVAWITDEGEDGDVELRRWSAPQLPESLDRSFPARDESLLVAGGLASFGIRFADEEGNWSGRWDSSTILESSELPVAAEIEVAFLTGVEGEVDGPYTRKIVIPMRPIDLAAQIAEAAGQEQVQGELEDEDGDGDIDEEDAAIRDEREAEQGGVDTDGDGVADEPNADIVTVEQCLAMNPQLAALVNRMPGVSDLVNGSMGQPASQFETVVGGLIPGGFPENCR